MDINARENNIELVDDINCVSDCCIFWGKKEPEPEIEVKHVICLRCQKEIQDEYIRTHTK